MSGYNWSHILYFTSMVLLQSKLAPVQEQHPMVDISLFRIMEMKSIRKSPSTKHIFLIQPYNSSATPDLFCRACTRSTEYVRRMIRGQDWNRHVLVNIWADRKLVSV